MATKWYPRRDNTTHFCVCFMIILFNSDHCNRAILISFYTFIFNSIQQWKECLLFFCLLIRFYHDSNWRRFILISLFFSKVVLFVCWICWTVSMKAYENVCLYMCACNVFLFDDDAKVQQVIRCVYVLLLSLLFLKFCFDLI